MPWLKCKLCDTDFYAKPRHIRMGWGKYCSGKCSFNDRRKGEWVNCGTCKTFTYKQPRALKASKSKKYFCNKSCFAVWKNKNILTGENHVNWKNGENSYRSIMKRNNILQACKRCQVDDARVLVVHHLDKDRSNNSLKNLVWLCHNCHFMVHHYSNEREKFYNKIGAVAWRL
ncbi:MAG TPA: HNH endonuclease signature motif containing protein [Patescibacteria group bacterium]|nr:HNH endonuclease signature motif containing protein [Patescibacteria group bacterium]